MRLIPLVLIAIIVLLVIGFMAQNANQKVEVFKIGWYSSSEVNLMFVLYGTFAFGVVMGFLIPVFQYLGAKSETRKLKREMKKIRSELDDLRNVGIESGLEDEPESPESAEETDSSQADTEDQPEDEN